jgi:hypothetical protein
MSQTTSDSPIQQVSVPWPASYTVPEDPVAAFFANHDAYERGNALIAERKVVSSILRWAGVKRSTVATFAELEQMGFGAHLVMNTRRIRLGTVLSDLMTRPTRSQCYSAYENARNAEPALNNTCFGIVMQWRSSFWVFHDVDLGGTLGAAGFYVTINDKVFFFERVESLVSKLGPANEW